MRAYHICTHLNVGGMQTLCGPATHSAIRGMPGGGGMPGGCNVLFKPFGLIDYKDF